MLRAGEYYLDDDRFSSVSAHVFFIVYAVVAPIIMLNLLIAIISDSFDKMKEKEGAQFLRERASLLAEYQIMLEMLPFVARWADMNPKYIHVLKPAGDLSAREQEAQWSGRIRGLKTHVKEQVGGVKAEVEALNAKLDAQDAKVEAVNSKLDAKVEALNSKLDAILRALGATTATRAPGRSPK